MENRAWPELINPIDVKVDWAKKEEQSRTEIMKIFGIDVRMLDEANGRMMLINRARMNGKVTAYNEMKKLLKQKRVVLVDNVGGPE